jgi:mono/diheme cytochrome c family protein
MQKRPPLLIAAATTAALTLAAIVVAAVVVYGGFYDVASTRPHWQITHTLLEFAMRRSVRRHAHDIREPALADAGMALRGAACFRDKCVQCHGGPGVAPGDIGKSMQPIPGALLDPTPVWRPRELYWITRNGIKMSGMPAWEYRLTESELWDVVAFLRRLPELKATEYAQWLQQAPPGPACGRGPDAPPAAGAADVLRGRHALQQYACHACHAIPGVTSSSPQVGPSLQGVGSRQVLAGTVVNTPENLVLWLTQTQKMKPGTAMPQMGVAEQDARDMAAYLRTLR